MHLTHKQEIVEFIIKILIASLAGAIIIFYNVEAIDQKNTKEELYNQSILHYSYNQKNEDTIETGSIIGKIDFHGERTQKDIQEIQNIILDTIVFIDNILRTEQSLQDNIVNITINKEIGLSRGYATHDTITINYGNMDRKEFVQVLTHELSHIIDLGIIEGTSAIKDSEYTEFNEPIFSEDDKSLGYYSLSRINENKKNNIAKEKDFCSIYGMSNPFEDFAECSQLYLNHHDYFTDIKKESSILAMKYEFIKKLFGGMRRYNNYGSTVISKEERIRDSTKL